MEMLAVTGEVFGPGRLGPCFASGSSGMSLFREALCLCMLSKVPSRLTFTFRDSFAEAIRQISGKYLAQ
jgi:hypothetical protein